MVLKLFAHVLSWIPSPVTLESCTITSETSLFHRIMLSFTPIPITAGLLPGTTHAV
ncbi:hypothetical protein WG66_011683 [Moniliophthora roreri]|nr:hypothetical protein WG66_011683 [Moniliophthora roreri]